MAMVASTSRLAAYLGFMLYQKKSGAADTLLPPKGGEGIFYALGLHFAAQQPDLAAQGAAAQAPFFAEHGAAAQQPDLATLVFLTFFDFAEHAPQLLREIGAQVASAAVGATAIVRPPATASIVARLTDFDILILLVMNINYVCDFSKPECNRILG